MVHNDYRLMDKHSEWDYRCDDFIKNHEGRHILFLGDSFAAGDGLDKEDTWCYKVYDKLSKIEKTSGYFNLGSSGSSISESIDQFFKYCYLYGNPDVVFFITTELNRETRYGPDTKESLKGFVYRMYLYLEQYCRSNKIQLYSFSWLKSVNEYSPRPEIGTYIDKNGEERKRPSWTRLASSEVDLVQDTLSRFETFYDYTEKEMMEKVFEFDINNPNKKKSLWALDGAHPGTSFHDFYSDFIFKKYKDFNK